MWNRCAGREDSEVEAIFAELNEYYSEPDRFYHTARHINHCLANMDKAEVELGHSDTVELAIWFHDVIYISGAPDNEQLSAEWFASKAMDSLPVDVIHQIKRYIMSTTHHELPDDDGSKFVVDVDLSGFGLPPEYFRRDGENIRKEFAYMSDVQFIEGQNRFMQMLLDRERIYSTSYFYKRFETQARKNISDTLKYYQ